MKRLRIPFLFLSIVLSIAGLLALPMTAAAADTPSLISETAVLMDAETGQVLFEKNMHRLEHPASITKIMTTLLAVESCELSEVITMSQEAVFSVPRNASHIALTTDEQITVEQALYGAMLPSANEACNGVAEHISGSVEAFAARMTERAHELGAQDTSFKNANGLDEEGHLTTAYDMALITRAAIQNEAFLPFFSTVLYEIPPTNKQKDTRYLWSLHDMMKDTKWYYEGIVGGKTGYTDDAQHTLVTVASRAGRTLIAVVMKSSHSDDKYKDTTALLDYGFEQFKPLVISQTELESADLSAQPNYQGVSGKIAAKGDLTFLVTGGVKLKDIVASFGPLRVENGDTVCEVQFRLSNSGTGMYPVLGSTTVGLILDSDFVSETVLHPQEVSSEQTPEPDRLWGLIGKILLAVLAVVLLGAAVLGLYALYLIRRYKKRQRHRRGGGAPVAARSQQGAKRRPASQLASPPHRPEPRRR